MSQRQKVTLLVLLIWQRRLGMSRGAAVLSCNAQKLHPIHKLADKQSNDGSHWLVATVWVCHAHLFNKSQSLRLIVCCRILPIATATEAI